MLDRHAHSRLPYSDLNAYDGGLQSPRLSNLCPCTPTISKCRESTLCDPKVPAFPWVLCLSLTEDKMGIRHVWWFQHETVTRFNAKYRQRRREVCLPKGALPTGSGVAPDQLTKSHKDGRVRAQQPNSCVAHAEQEIWPPQKQPGGREGSLSCWSLPVALLAFTSSHFARHYTL